MTTKKQGLECPECGDAGPKDDNGQRGMEMSFCCGACGAHFDRTCSCGYAYGEDVGRMDRCDHCEYLTR